MARLLSNKNGRLRPGLVAMLFLAMLMAGASMVLKIQTPVNKTLVAVKHVFKSPPAGEPSEITPPEKPVPPASSPPEKAKPMTEKKDPPEALPPAPVTVTPPVPEPRAVAPPIPEPQAVAPPVPEPRAVTPPVPEPRAPRAASPEPAVHQASAPPPRTVKKEPPLQIKPVAKTPPTLPSVVEKEQKQIGLATPSHKRPELDISKELKHLSSWKPASSPASTAIADDKIKSLAALSEKKTTAKKEKIAATDILPIQTNTKMSAVTVPPEQYKQIFHEWRKLGADNKPAETIPFRVENLRRHFALFQMKPVAVINGKPFSDLSGGTRIAPGMLADYSATVFLVDQPWEKWGDALSRAGLHNHPRVEVRYYMYDFVKASIYARVAAAFEWCKQKNLIPRDTQASTVDVLGRVYTIEQKGGGSFGVFIPVSLDTTAGVVTIDPACFQGQQDVEMLLKTGLL